MDFVTQYTNDSKEKILLRRIDDLIRRSEKTYTVLYTNFLTPAEQTLVSKVSEFCGRISFAGGYDDAERRVCRICTEEYAQDEGLPAVLFCAQTAAADAQLSHRDVLGALMGLGIRREMIGDILASRRKAFFFCISSVAEFVELNLDKIGRYSISLSVTEPEDMPEPETEEIHINVSSMRLDSVCGECFGVSRTKAAEIIRRGLVSVNWQITDSISREVKAGDRISMRGKGKIRLGEVTGQSKKGRLFVTVYRYV